MRSRAETAGAAVQDLHESITVKSLERMASCIVRALPAERLSHSFARNQQPDLAAEVLIKQRTGMASVQRASVSLTCKLDIVHYCLSGPCRKPMPVHGNLVWQQRSSTGSTQMRYKGM